MACVQIIEMHTKDYEQLQALGGEFFAATEGKRTLQRSFVTLGRNDPDRAWILGCVDSHESAMSSPTSPRPRRSPIYDLDLIEDRT